VDVIVEYTAIPEVAIIEIADIDIPDEVAAVRVKDEDAV
jgi:hypothetical protein